MCVVLRGTPKEQRNRGRQNTFFFVFLFMDHSGAEFRMLLLT